MLFTTVYSAQADAAGFAAALAAFGAAVVRDASQGTQVRLAAVRLLTALLGCAAAAVSVALLSPRF